MPSSVNDNCGTMLIPEKSNTITTVMGTGTTMFEQDDDTDADNIGQITERLVNRDSYRIRGGSRHHQNSNDSSSSMTIIMANNEMPLNTDQDYLEHIAKLQMDNLIPLKEDVADWLNRILNLDGPDQSLNIDNFMDRLDNGVLVCRLVRVLEDFIVPRLSSPMSPSSSTNDDIEQKRQNYLTENLNEKHEELNGSQIDVTDEKTEVLPNGHDGHDDDDDGDDGGRTKCPPVPKTRHRQSNETTTSNRRLSLSSLNTNGVTPGNIRRPYGRSPSFNTIGQFHNHVSWFRSSTPMKCWENAKRHTFFARDNVSNFLDWCRRFGVKDAVLFETEDLVSHVNQRNVVLCLLEVARIACTKYSFSPAPGLVEFEVEIDREIEKELQRHRQRQEAKQQQSQQQQQRKYSKTGPEIPEKPNVLPNGRSRVSRKLWPTSSMDCTDNANGDKLLVPNGDNNNNNNGFPYPGKSLLFKTDDDTLISGDPVSSVESSKDGGFIDSSVDSGSYSSNNSVEDRMARSPSSNSVLSSASSGATSTYYGDNNSSNGYCETSSTCSSTPTPMTSELDHKVMQIAKTYYGKEARQGVQRLSEGKYRIANRIVFVRLLKARHVMVRVGGGWTTLSHFLARHGGDPNQQILPDELLPLDTKSSQVPQNHGSNTTSSRNNNNYGRQISAPVTGSTTHTLVISTKTPTSRKSSTSSSKSSLSSTEIIGSTPVSRRNSVTSTNSQIDERIGVCNGPSSTTKIPVLSNRKPLVQRGRLASVDLSATPHLALLRSNSSIISNHNGLRALSAHQNRTLPTASGPSSPGISMIPRSTTEFGSMRRYANYLKSSQHITNRPGGSTRPTSPVQDQITTPLAVTPRPRKMAAPVTANQKTC